MYRFILIVVLSFVFMTFSCDTSDDYTVEINKTNENAQINFVPEPPISKAEKVAYENAINGSSTECNKYLTDFHKGRYRDEISKLLYKKLGEEHKKNKKIYEEIRNGEYDRACELTEITKEIARILDEVPYYYLIGLKSISAEVVLEFKEACFDLSGLTSISVEVARALVKVTGDDSKLTLDGLTSISVPITRELAKIHVELSLNGLKSITEDIARELAKCCGQVLYLNGLKSISLEVAEALADIDCIVELNGLESMDSSIARAFASKLKWLYFNGLTSISEEVALELSSYGVQQLHMNGLKTMSPEVARHIAKIDGQYVCLQGLTSISEETAKELAKCKIPIWIKSKEIRTLISKYK